MSCIFVSSRFGPVWVLRAKEKKKDVLRHAVAGFFFLRLLELLLVFIGSFLLPVVLTLSGLAFSRVDFIRIRKSRSVCPLWAC